MAKAAPGESAREFASSVIGESPSFDVGAACGGRAARTPSARHPRSDRLAQRLERGPQLRREELRLLPGGEMSALRKLVVVDELGIGLLGPALRRLVDLVREGADGDRDLDAPDVEEAARGDLRVVPVEARRGDRRVRQPVERDVVEDVVRRQALLLSVEGRGRSFDSCGCRGRASMPRGRPANSTMP